MVFESSGAKDTKKFANRLAKKFYKKGGIIALIGELGAGKTIFAQGFAKGLGVKEKIISPTFVLIRQHQIPSIVIPVSKTHLFEPERPQSRGPESSNPHVSGRTSFARMTEEGSNKNRIFYHLDLYRLEDRSAPNQLGINEILDNGNKGDIVIIEWAEKIMDKLPKKTLKIFFEKTGKISRKLTLKHM